MSKFARRCAALMLAVVLLCMAVPAAFAAGNKEDAFYTIGLDACGGVSSTVVVTTNLDGKLTTLPESPTMDGYTFNGWYTENYLASAPPALEHGVFIGAAGEGKIASATRADYAAAAAKVISEEGHAGKVYELAGDNAWTLSELAAELSKQSGKPVTYQNLSEADYAAALKGVGLPAGLAEMLADSDTGASKGGLFDDSRTLSKLIGRPTTPLAESIKAIL